MKLIFILAIFLYSSYGFGLSAFKENSTTDSYSMSGEESIPNLKEESDHFSSFAAICRNKGYPFEQHKIITYDGYFLTTFRIPGKKGEKLENAIADKRPVVLLWHGLLDSADSWIINDEENAPAFILANQGYDVWVGNSRGNKHSREHRFLDPDREEDKESFFGFNIEDMSTHDTNATVDYIRQETGKRTIGVIGHGAGATQFLLSPQTGIEVLVTLGAMTLLDHTEERLITTLAQNDQIIKDFKDNKIYEVFAENYEEEELLSSICQNSPTICKFIIENIMLVESDYINMDRVDEMLAHFPSGTGLENVEHFVQIFKENKFQKFDYGLELNRKIYNRDTPPEFDLSKVSNFNIIQIVGEEDHISTPLDNHWLNAQLGSKVDYYGSFRIGHYSFLIGNDMSYLTKVIELFKKNKWD